MTIQERIHFLQSLVPKEWLTVRETQIYANKTEATIHRWINQNKVVSKKGKSGRRFILRVSIDKWFAGITEEDLV